MEEWPPAASRRALALPWPSPPGEWPLPPATVQVHDAHGKPQAFSPFLAEEALDMPSPQMHEQEALGQDSQESLGLSFS